MNIKWELENIRERICEAYRQSSNLSTYIVEKDNLDSRFADELDEFTTGLEHTTLRVRRLNETCYPKLFPTDADEEHLPSPRKLPVGTVTVESDGWLHITLDTLLPHCKKKSSPWLRDTITRLLHDYKRGGGRLPYFEHAMLVINEHCDIESRRVFDQDNKGWKVIPNALKGIVIADDDQFSLGVSLVSTWSDSPACHIYVMDIAEAGTYFSLYHSDSGSYFAR